MRTRKAPGWTAVMLTFTRNPKPTCGGGGGFRQPGKCLPSVHAQLEAPAQGILRLEAKPGRYKARVSFVNEAVENPPNSRWRSPTAWSRLSGHAGSRRGRISASNRRTASLGTLARTDYAQKVWKITALPKLLFPTRQRKNSAYSK